MYSIRVTMPCGCVRRVSVEAKNEREAFEVARWLHKVGALLKLSVPIKWCR